MVQEVILTFAILSGIIFLGFISELIFKKTKIPDVLFLIFIGILLGSFFHIVDVKDFIGEGSKFGFLSILFTTFSLIFILFQGALNIEFKTLFLSLKSTAKLSILSFLVTSTVVSSIAFLFFGYSLILSILFGIILGGTSSAVVIPIVSILPIDKKYGSVLTLESAITDVFCIVGAITVFTIIVAKNITTSEIVKSIISSFLVAIGIGIIAGFFWIFLLSKERVLRNSYMTTIAVVIALYAFVESPFVSSSGAISALSFGIVLGNSESIIHFFNKFSKDNGKTKSSFLDEIVLSYGAKNFYEEISFFVKVFFFVYLGLLIDFSKPLIFIYGAMVTLGVFLARIIIVNLAFYNEIVDKRSKAFLKVLVPKGLAAAVLASLAIEKGIPGAENLVSIVFSTIFISIIVSSILVFIVGFRYPESIANPISSLNKKRLQQNINNSLSR